MEPEYSIFVNAAQARRPKANFNLVVNNRARLSNDLFTFHAYQENTSHTLRRIAE